MKKLFMLVLILATLLCLWSYDMDEQTSKKNYYTHFSTTSNNSVNISIENKDLSFTNTKSTHQDEFTFSKTYALPVSSADLKINSLIIETYNLNGELIETKNSLDANFIKVSQSFTFKDMRGFTLTFSPIQKDNGNTYILKNADICLSGNNSILTATEISEAFAPLYEQLAVNYQDSYLHNLPTKKPSMIIISRSSLSEVISDYIKWRKACGFDIQIFNIETLGNNPSNDQVKQEIVNLYNASENKADFLMLIGDSNSSSPYKLPTFYVTGISDPEICATDLPYTLLEGDDYFPEMLVGRLCVDTEDDLRNILTKTIRYERVSIPNTNNWQNKGLVVAGNYATGETIPTTPVDMSRWIYEKLLSRGYSQVDTVFFQDSSGAPPSSLTDQIKNFINQGTQYISYRGWGSADGWSYPAFKRIHLAMTNNGGKTPVVLSIVCDNGDFDYPTYDCLGEEWMRKGTSSAPDGAVAFVGPSFLHTSTPLNNSLSSGIFRGIMDENIRIFGSAVMRGKIELYNNFPNNQGVNDNAPFYFKIYNMLSDPSLNLWKLQPNTLQATIPDEIEESQNYLEISLPGINNGVVTSTKDYINYNYTRITNGSALIPIDNTVTGNVRLTINVRNYLPIYKQITVNSSNKIGLVSYTLSSPLISGQTAEFSLSVKNFSTSAVSNAICTISSENTMVSIDDNSIEIGNMNAGETKIITFQANVSASCPDQTQLPFTFTFSPTESVSKIMALVGGLSIEILNPSITTNEGIINPGTTGSIQLTLKNNSVFNVSNLNAVIHPMTNAVSCSQTPISVTTINAGQTQNISFSLAVESSCYVGREAMFYVDFSTSDGKTCRAYFTITIGNVTNTAPTGPDNFGYFAYDSNDAAYASKPTYNWIEIDPDLGGSGVQTLMTDDSSINIDLPFVFKFYGINYDKMTICSNGWISFIQTWKTDFSNWNIPSALGPYTMIAPYWDDLKGVQTSSVTWDPLHVSYYWDSVNSRFIIEWNSSFNAFNNTSPEVFQIILLPIQDQNGEIIFQYQTVDNPAASNNFATVGIENHNQNDGVLYTYGNIYPASASELANNLAIKFTTNAPDNFVGNADLTDINKNIVLNQNYPNPFNPTTNISFNIPKSGKVKLEIFNIKGQKVHTLIDKQMEKGTHNITWNAKDENNKELASGIYFYKLNCDNKNQMKKMILIK